jgi:hypothetical protein
MHARCARAPPQHRLPPATSQPDLLMAVVDFPPAPWTSLPPERRGGELSRPHNLLSCHPHVACSIPDHAHCRWHHVRQDPHRRRTIREGGGGGTWPPRPSPTPCLHAGHPSPCLATRAAPMCDRYHRCQIRPGLHRIRTCQPCSSP